MRHASCGMRHAAHQQKDLASPALLTSNRSKLDVAQMPLPNGKQGLDEDDSRGKPCKIRDQWKVREELDLVGSFVQRTGS